MIIWIVKEINLMFSLLWFFSVLMVNILQQLFPNSFLIITQYVYATRAKPKYVSYFFKIQS